MVKMKILTCTSMVGKRKEEENSYYFSKLCSGKIRNLRTHLNINLEVPDAIIPNFDTFMSFVENCLVGGSNK